MMASLVITQASCTTIVVCPRSPTHPVTVFVIDHGRTSSLVVPSDAGGVLRYAYGDWSYYALGKTDVFHGAAAVLWPTRGALGRSQLAGPPSVDQVRRQVHSIESIHAVQVERASVAGLVRELEDLYHANLATEVTNSAYNMSFVHHPRSYTYFWNSNHEVAAWLRELGCTTRGPSHRASWSINP